MNRKIDQSQALRHVAVPNLAVVRRVIDGLGITEFEQTSSYIKAIRPDGKPFIGIWAGYTEGFATREEAERFAPNGKPWPSDMRKGAWGISHPHGGAPFGGRGATGKPDEVDYGTCTSCFTRKTVSGTCLCDD